jgi:hypothetical protein
MEFVGIILISKIWSSMVFDKKILFEKLQIVVNTYILGLFTMVAISHIPKKNSLKFVW